MPLGGIVLASKYGDDENYLEFDQIDLRVLSPAASTLEKWKVSGAIGTAPCDCENLKTLLRQSPLSIQNQSRPSSN